MSNKIRQEMNKIDIPKELSERSKLGVSKAKSETRKKFGAVGIGLAAAFILSIGAFYVMNHSPTAPETVVVTEGGGLKLPAIQLPDDPSSADMIGLVVFNGKIYTQSHSEIAPADAKALLGEKLGTSKGTIDEWSSQEEYDEEFASTIRPSTIYSVKGYDQNFRIMAYSETNGEVYTEFFENLNGITVKNGEDVFGKLNLEGNVATAEFRKFSDWDQSVENFHPISDLDVLNAFIDELNRTKPLPRSENSDPIGMDQYRNDDSWKNVTLHLKDGTQVTLTLLKDGYIYYGFMGAYFKMEDAAFSKMWEQLQQ